METPHDSPLTNLVPLPDAVRARCRGPNRWSGADTMIELVTLGTDGWPHVAQLSVGELDLADDGLIRLALWNSSQSSAALASGAVALLLFIEAGSIFEVRCKLICFAKLHTGLALTGFLLAPVTVRDKQVPYAEILSGSRFRLLDPVEVKGRWKEAQDALRLRFPSRAGINQEFSE